MSTTGTPRSILTGPRLTRAIEVDNFKSGFTFLRTGRELDREAILGLEREKIVHVVCQTDRTGAGSGIRRIVGKKWIIGAHSRGEALALVWNGTTKSRVTTAIINEALKEAAAMTPALKTPLRIYGTTCSVSETRSFRFCQIPDEILAALASSRVEDDLVEGIEE